MKKTGLMVFVVAAAMILSSISHLAQADWSTGGMIGAAIGGPVGVGASYAACSKSDEKSRCVSYALPLGASLGGGLGFGIGALIGHFVGRNDGYSDASDLSHDGTMIVPTMWIDPKNSVYGVGAGAVF